MAKVVRIHKFGGPEGLSIDQIDVAAPGPGEVLIEVGAIGLNRAETMVMNGDFGQFPLPAAIGYEAAGKVLSIGSDVADVAVGDRVAILPGLPLPYGACGDTILCPAELLVKLLEGQPYPEAAATWMAYITAYAVRAFRPIAAGEAVLITAASSSVGLAAIQIVNADGGVPIAVTRGKAKADALRRHGAAHVITSDEQDVSETVMEITSGRGAAVALDPIGGPKFPAILSSLSQGGLAVVYGGLGGEPTNFSAPFMSFRELSIRGFATNHFMSVPQQKSDVVAYIKAGLLEGKFKPVIDRRFALAEITEAYRHLLRNEQIGKIVVIP
jgi:NADPH:quinone reductase-like Zn-dependent oxidoreductase